eukprot:GHVT01094696.1.p1 GENE.GHVT01094696.1~~GHVT01094696.1.p1  ORF type:complete len:108 (-),score=3.13 GHVT01094696.1:310-633(-)
MTFQLISQWPLGHEKTTCLRIARFASSPLRHAILGNPAQVGVLDRERVDEPGGYRARDAGPGVHVVGLIHQDFHVGEGDEHGVHARILSVRRWHAYTSGNGTVYQKE